MKKRHKKTLRRTLSLAALGVELALVGILFVPIVVVIENLPKRETARKSPTPIVPSMPAVDVPVLVRETPPPKELIRIYSIVKSRRPDISETEAKELSEVILEECSWYGLDPMLVLAVINVESKFQYGAVSSAGARGIMQILPYVGKSLLQEIGLHQTSYAFPFRAEFLDDPFLNIKLGVYYLHGLRKSFRNLTHTLTAYNMGPTETRNRLENDIELSQKYATLVLATYQEYKSKKARLPPTF